MNFLWRRKQQELLSQELAAHLEELADELVSSGYDPEQARYEARRRFGNGTALLEQSREVWRLGWLDSLLGDLRFSWRLTKRQPWTMAAAVASIAIGVGANTAVTSVVDTILLNPLGLRDSNKIVAATVHIEKLKMSGVESSGAEFQDLQASSDVFSGVAATDNRSWAIGGDQPTRLLGVAVTPEFFKVFGVNMTLGSNPNGVLISDGLWRTRFGQDSHVVGQKLLLDGKPFDIVGVAPASFHFPARAEVWIPLRMSDYGFVRGNNMVLSLYARLRNGVSGHKAQQRVDHELLKLRATADGVALSKMGYGLDVEPVARRVAGDLRLPLLFLWVAAIVLLVAACANVAGLLLARAGSRRREIAIRISVGASRLQILRQLLTDSLLLALAGGVFGLALASVLLGILKRQPLPFQQMISLVKLDARMMLYGLGLALVSSLIFGIVPAVELLREQHAAGLARTRRKWFQNVYIVGQVSAAMLLLVVMGLLLRSLQAVELLRPGFDARDLTTAFLIKPSQDLSGFYARLLAGLQASPGVESAALAYSIPFAGDAPTSLFDIKGHRHVAGEPEWHGEAYQVTPDYFATLRMKLLRGRLIEATDTADKPLVCVIDEALARRFLPNEDPIGQEIAMYKGWARIVGVVSTLRDQSLENESRPVAYYPLAQVPYFQQLGVVVRSAIPAAGIIREAVAKANPAVPVFDAKTMEERIDASEATRSVLALLVTVFAGISILLAAIGIHGVVAQVVSERTAEIGVRMALGAQATDIFKRFLLQGLRLALAGIAIGLALAAGCSGLLRSFLYHLEPIDPLVMACGVFGVLLVSAAAVMTPAWRAARVDPQIALRSE